MDTSPLSYILVVKGVVSSNVVMSTMTVNKAFNMSNDVGASDVKFIFKVCVYASQNKSHTTTNTKGLIFKLTSRG